MRVSSFFESLATAYQAEMDDLTFDSEGKDVLRQRLAEKRKELAFLRQMIELSPEMVAVVFHQGFRFLLPSVMEDVVNRESDELPEWDSLADVVTLQPWALELAKGILSEPMGEWFMTVAAGLEYLYAKPGKPVAPSSDDDDSDDDEQDDHGDDLDDFDDQEDDDSREGGARRRDEAGEDWMEEQGFDRKGH